MKHHSRSAQRGFTLIELAIATLILLIGIAAVGQLVPNALMSNLRQRYDSKAVVIAERELNQMINQPLTATQFADLDGRVILLGNVAATGLTGNAVISFGNSARVDFGAAAVGGYNFNYVDPNDPVGVSYEVRWAVASTVQGTTVVSKRFLVGVWKRDPRSPIPPVTVEATVDR